MAENEFVVCSSRKKPLKVGDITFGSFFDFELTQQDLEKAHQELNEKEEDRDSCIRKLRKKLEEHTEFRYQTDDYYLLAFLRFRKFDIDRTYKTIRKGHSVKVGHPEMFAVPPNLEQLCNKGFLSWSPYRDEQGRTIIMAHFGKWHLNEMSVQELLQLCSCLYEVAFKNPHCQINGTVCVWDFKELTLSHTTSILSPSLLWTLSSFVQECFPHRIGLLVFINCPSLFHAAFNTAKLFLKKKIVDRIKILGSDITELHQYVNPALLPKELGGKLENEDCDVNQHIMDNLSYLKHIRTFTTASDNPLH